MENRSGRTCVYTVALVRGEEYGLAPSPFQGEGWGEVVQGIKQQSYEINFVQVLKGHALKIIQCFSVGENQDSAHRRSHTDIPQESFLGIWWSLQQPSPARSHSIRQILLLSDS